VYSQTYFEITYPDLCRWTKTLPDASRNCFVTFGLSLSYFACAPGHGSIWAGIPSELEDKVRKSLDTPCCVSLGAYNAWFVLWPDGNCTWKFNGHYNALDRILNEAVPRSVAVSIAYASRNHTANDDDSMSLSLHTTSITTSLRSETSPSNTISQVLHPNG